MVREKRATKPLAKVEISGTFAAGGNPKESLYLCTSKKKRWKNNLGSKRPNDSWLCKRTFSF